MNNSSYTSFTVILINTHLITETSHCYEQVFLHQFHSYTDKCTLDNRNKSLLWTSLLTQGSHFYWLAHTIGKCQIIVTYKAYNSTYSYNNSIMFNILTNPDHTPRFLTYQINTGNMRMHTIYSDESSGVY